jgi:acetyltransferase
VLAADSAERAGLLVTEPSSELREKLSQFLPSYSALRNPIDLTVEGTEVGYRETLCAVLEKEYDAALALDVSTPYLDSVSLARGVSDAAYKTVKPIATCFMAGKVVAKAIAYLKKRGLTNFQTGERAVSVLAHMAEFYEHKTNKPIWSDIQYGNNQLPGGGVLLEPDAMKWLRENGFPTPEFGFASNEEEAVKVCREIGYPTVMKVVSPDIAHKSDWSGVKLDINNDSVAQKSFQCIQKAANSKDFRGVIIYPMIHSAQEVLLGITNDPQFGPLILFGMGGIYTEVLEDISLRIAPIDRTGADQMIREIRSFPILEGIRGQPPCDLDTLADTMIKFSKLPFQYTEIAEVDLNPVFLFSKGLVIGDVRVIRKESRA